MNKPIAIVTGGAGFIGSHMVDLLLSVGYQVHVLDNFTGGHERNLEQHSKNSALHVEKADICKLDPRNKLFDNAKYVFHFAAVADIKEAQENPVKTVEVNILSTAYILDACRKHNVSRFLFGSTIYVYSNYGSFYRSSKQACELIIENYHDIYNIDYTILRYGSLYGPRANKFNLINKVITQALKDKKITREGNGQELREYIHVKDAAKASVKMLDDGYSNSNIMITGIQAMRIRDFFVMVNEIFENKIEIEYLDSKELDKHYNITPYTFKPKVATRYQLKNYHDLGQGVLDQIHEIYENLLANGEIEKSNPFTK